MPRHTIELNQAPLGIAPKAFNAMDMGIASCELIVAMIDPKILIAQWEDLFAMLSEFATDTQIDAVDRS